MKKYGLYGAGVVIAVLVLAGLWILTGPFGDKAPATIEEQGPSFEAQFEDILNTLLAETAGKAKVYRDQRKILGELVKPVNLSSPDYVQENYTMMQSMLPLMRRIMDEIMEGFAAADAAVADLIQDRPAEKTAQAQEKWQTLKQQQMGTYIRFFETEEGILRAYEELMAVYYDTQGRFSVDAQQGRVIFENPQDELNAQVKRRVLDEALRSQAEILGKE